MDLERIKLIEGERIRQIAGLIPPSVDSVLDVGCAEARLRPLFKKYTGIDLENAEIVQNLEANQKIDLLSDSYEMVILSQILEHISNPTELISEAKRISSKYILVGMPSEYTIDNRIRFLLNRRGTGYYEFGHKHWFNIDTADLFVKDFFGLDFERKQFIFAVKGGGIMPAVLRNFLAEKLPNLFAKEVYYLFETSKTK